MKRITRTRKEDLDHQLSASRFFPSVRRRRNAASGSGLIGPVVLIDYIHQAIVMKRVLIAIAVFLSIVSCTNRQMQPKEKEYPEALFTLGEISTVELEMPEETWQAIITKASDKNYYECAVTINGERFDNVAIRTKGASSLDDVQLMKSDRYSFTLKLNKYEKGQDYHGLTKLLLNNNIWDATQMKDAIVYDMCRYIGLPDPLLPANGPDPGADLGRLCGPGLQRTDR